MARCMLLLSVQIAELTHHAAHALCLVARRKQWRQHQGRSWPAGPRIVQRAALIFLSFAKALCCARRVVLRGRCDHFRARCDSGMRDAEDREIHVPEHFSKASFQ